MTPESTLYDLILVSAFGRGNWIAMELAGRGWKVALVDVTSSMKPSPWEDVEGPFGVLESQDLLPSQRARLADEGELVPVPGGFTMWLPEGPLEFRSEITPFLLRARKISPEVETYLRRSGLKSRESERERKSLSRLMYAKNWLAQFAHVFTANAHSENHASVETGTAAPLFSAYSVRQMSGSGHAKGLALMRTAGVHVISKAKVRDVRVGEKHIDAIELEGEQGVVVERARAFVWCVSFENTRAMSEQLSAKLYPRGGPEAQWSWERFRFSIEMPMAMLASLPLWCVVIDDVDLAWTRANMMVLRRWPQARAIDVWLKVPAWMRKEDGALQSVLDDVTASLTKRLPAATLTRQDQGQEPRPLQWPVFDRAQAQFTPLKSANLFFHAPDLWPTLDWNGRFRFANGVVEKLEKMKAKWDEIARKQSEKERRAKA